MQLTVAVFGFVLSISLFRPSDEPDEDADAPSMHATGGGQFERAEPLWSGSEEFGFTNPT